MIDRHQGAQAITKVLNVGLLGLVHQHVAWVRLGGVVAHLGDKSCLRHIEVAAALVHFFAALSAGSGVHSVTT